MLKYSRTRTSPSPLKEKRTEIPSGHGVNGSHAAIPPASTSLPPMHALNNNNPGGYHHNIQQVDVGSNIHYRQKERDRHNANFGDSAAKITTLDGNYGQANSTISLGEIMKIYTDWANHYLEKGQKKRIIVDLQKDMQDSVLLIDVVEAVTGEKVPDIKRKPKNAAQVVENIGSCLQYLSNLGVNVDGLTAKDIREGQLKSILGLFFSLSRYKQQQKSAIQQQHQLVAVSHSVHGSRHNSPHSHQQNSSNTGPRNLSSAIPGSNDMLSRLPSPFKSVNSGNGSSIPTGIGAASNGSSQIPSSGIPALAGISTQKTQLTMVEKKDTNACNGPPSKIIAPSGLKAPSVVINSSLTCSGSKLPGPALVTQATNLSASSSPATSITKLNTPSGLKPPSATSKSASVTTSGIIGKANSNLQQSTTVKEGKMLEKLKLFGKDKSAGSASGSTVSSPRPPSAASKCSSSSSSTRGGTSSICTTSSGFSSGKSELSDSTEGGASTSSGGSSKGPLSAALSNGKPCSPKMSLKALTKKSFASSKNSSSPKTSRKETVKPKMESVTAANVVSGNSVQTSPMMSKRLQPPKQSAVKEPNQDASDPGYLGCDSSPSSNVTQGFDPKCALAPPQKKTSGERKSPIGLPAAATGAAVAIAGSKLAIPKPTMAVKGTTKPAVPIRDESTRLETVPAGSLPASNLAKPSSLPKTNSRQKLSSVMPNANSADAAPCFDTDSGAMVHTVRAPKIAKQPAANPTPSGFSPSTSVTPSTNPMSPGSSGAVVGVVSPITHHRKITANMVPSGGADLNSSLESTVGHQSDSNSSHTSGNQSDTASVIYCPSADEAVAVQRSGQTKLVSANRISRSTRSTSTATASNSNLVNEQKLREMSLSPASRTQSRLETTFDSSDGVIVTTQTLTTTSSSGSDKDEDRIEISLRSKSAEKSGPSDYYETSAGCLSGAGAEEELAAVVVEPMQPLLPRASPYAYLKNYATAAAISTPIAQGSVAKVGSASKRPQQEIIAGSSVAAASRAALVRAKSPRLLLNKPLATLLHADANGDPSSALEAIRQATASGDGTTCGYVSDGDALALTSAISNHAPSNISTTSAGAGGYGGVGELDISGYMSEGGISLYARKMQARFREGLEAVRDSMREKKSANADRTTMANFVDDSCEDSSSLSSGISEAFDEISTDDLTGSSLSDHAAVGGNNFSHHPSSKRTTTASHHLRKTVESGQQTDSGEGQRRQRQQQYLTTDGAGASQLRKLSDQYDRHKIDHLLQKSRTNARGQGAELLTNASVVRPKSEQMTMMMMNEIQLSADGQTLRVSASNFGYPQHQPKRMPLATNSLKIMKTDFSNFGGQPPHRQGDVIMHGGNGQPSVPYMVGGHGAGSGYHSLDRKKHLLAYHDVDPAAARYYYSDAESLYVNYANVAVPRTSAGATLALVSPRRIPQMKRAEDIQQQQQAQACWTRHSVSGHHNNGNRANANNGNGMQSNGGTLPASMSRSMIEPELLSKPVQMVSHGGQEQSSPSSNGNHYQQHRINGHARLSIPPQNVLQSGLMSTQSPQLARCPSSQSESGLPPARKDCSGEALSPSSQLYLHKLLVNSPTSAGVLGFPESGLPPSPGSLSDRSVPNIRSSHGAGQSPYAAAIASGAIGPEEVHASSLSLASTSSSVYSTAEEKYQAEIRKLLREVDNYRDKVQTLTTQQSTYAHVVAAFEQSLHSMTKRVQSLTVAGEQKDFELLDLKQKIDALYQMSLAAGLNVELVLAPSPSLHRRHTFNNNGNGNEPPGLSRQISSESMHSTVSQRSSQSSGSSSKNANGSPAGNSKSGVNPNSSPTNSASGDKKQKKSWTPSMEVMQLRSSFSKAFGKSKSKTGSPGGKSAANGSVSDAEECSSGALARRLPSTGDSSYPNSPAKRNSTASGHLKPAGSLSGLNECDPADPVDQLKKQLADKDTKLTDIRLEALTSAHQVDQLKEAVNRMRAELAAVKNDNERLTRLLHSNRSRAGSQTSLPLLSDDNESVSEFGHVNSDMSVPICVDATMGDGGKDGIRIQVSVSLDLSGEISVNNAGELLIGSLCLTARVKWDLVDTFVNKLYKEYVLRIDPVSNLGLSAESIVGYQLGECQRLVGDQTPAALLSNILQDGRSGHSLRIALKGVKQNAVDSLAFETLIPKSIVQRYVHSLMEDKRIILCSLAGTGKSYLAKKLAEYLVLRNGRSFTDSVAVFDGGETATSGSKAAIEVKRFFQSLRNAEPQALPVVVILDNLHNMGPLNDLFTGLSSASMCPYIIGTMNQSNHSTTTLQLHHNFRWHPCANHTEPIKGFLGRYLRRRLIESEVKRANKYPIDLCKILDWLPKVWIHLNKYLEVINSSEASIGPAQFMDCPLDTNQSRLWFIRLWNDSLANYIREKASEGLHLYQKRASLEDPYEFVAQTWPWTSGEPPETVLTRIESEGEPGSLKFDSLGSGYRRNEYLLSDSEDPNDPDPLLMLMRLQEQAKSQKHNETNFVSVDVPLRQAETRNGNGRQLVQQNGGVESTF